MVRDLLIYGVSVEPIPHYMYKWKSPYKRFFINKLTLNYLKVYDYKAFTFITDTLLRRNYLNRLLPRAWIRYLVGYILMN